MLFLGASLMILTAFLVWREYTAFLKHEIDELSEIILLLENMRGRMASYLEKPGDWIDAYSTPLLEETGFLPLVRDGSDFSSALCSCSDELTLGNGTREILTELFSRLGSSYLDSELSLIDSAIERLSGLLDSLTGDSKNKSRAAGAVLGALAVGAAIMII